MSNVKVKVSFSLLMLLTLVMLSSSVFATDRIFNLTAKYDGKTVTDGQTIEVKSSAKTVSIEVNPQYVDSSLQIGYAWDNGGVQVAASGKKTATITIPNYSAGSTHTLALESLIKDHTHNYVGNSNVVRIKFTFPEDTRVSASLNKADGATITAGEKLTISTSSNQTVSIIAYRWDSEALQTVKGSSATITVPNFIAGSTHKLAIQACTSNNVYSNGVTYNLKMKEAEVKTTCDVSLDKASGSTVKVGDKLTATGTSNKKVDMVAYCWDNGNLVKVNGSKATITVPNFTAGSTHVLSIQACTEDDTYSAGKNYTFKIQNADVKTTCDVTLNINSSNQAKVGDILTATGTSNKVVAVVAYCWDNGSLVKVNGSKASITVPNYQVGTTHTLSIQACTEDDTYSQAKNYAIKIVANNSNNNNNNNQAKTTVDVTLNKASQKYVSVGEKLTASATSTNSDVYIVAYAWDNGTLQKVYSNKAVIEVPDFKEGSTHELAIQACTKDDTYSQAKYFNFIIDSEDDYDDESRFDDNNELYVEPYMKENDELEGLAVSLRSEPYEVEDRANKNIYVLDEKVVYYIDYKNGSKKTSKKVSIEFTLPSISYTVVDRDGGSYSKKNNKITWNFNGLDEDEAGTLTVVVKYTDLGGSKNLKYKRVTPSASIFLAGSKKDQSGIINLILKDFDLEINEEHEPYMFGDRDTGTFRPDDTITRAEGALVLTRIFGISTYLDDNFYAFPDLDETYVSARRAITAATKYGIIEGYKDGTYKPNKTMTRGEFLSIIARQIEAEEGNGFEIKGEADAVKLYKDKTRIYYVTNTQTYSSHWAVPYVTLLARLNMTPLSDKNTNLRLDEPITRAEVAQLVNFYLLRAPAKVTASTNIGFPDVTRNHALIGDIVEATREAHTYTFTDEGKEKAK